MPAEAKSVAVRGGLFNPPVFRAGKGDPILYLHAAGGLKGFTPDLEALSQHYEVIAPVLPGWEDTDGLQHIDDVWDMMYFLQDFCDAAGLKQMHVIGHSLGGMMAAEFAAARPDMVKKLVLTCPVGFWIPETPVADFFAMMPGELVPTLFADPASPAVAMMMKPPANEDELAQMMYLNAVNLAAAGKFMWPIPDRGLKKRIYRISSPTLVLWGDSDRLTPPAYGDLFHSKIANSQLRVIAGAGHMLPIEKTEEYVAEIRAFLG